MGYDMHTVIECLVDAGELLEVKPLFAPELIIGFGLMDGSPVGFVANNPMVKGGVLFTDTADKAARFIWNCDAFNVPLIFLACAWIHDRHRSGAPGDHPPRGEDDHGSVRGDRSQDLGDRPQGVWSWTSCTSGPAFEPEATIALPTAKIAVMGPEAAVNAVFANKIAAISDDAEREAFVAEQREIYEEDVDLLRLASELVIDAIVDWSGASFGHSSPAHSRSWQDQVLDRVHGVPPV